jgi:hypothetical protein
MSCCCGKLVVEARGQFENPEERELPPLEAVTSQGLANTQQTVKTKLCALVKCKVCELAKRLKLLVVADL